MRELQAMRELQTMSNAAAHRDLDFRDLDEVLIEAERLAAGEVYTTGAHSFGQILEHLARTHDMTTGRLQVPPPPLYMRLMITLMKPMLIRDQPIKPGFKLPKKSENVFWPDQEFEVSAALEHLRDSIEHYKSHGPMPKHPMFGTLSREQSDRLNCRHAALHLGFVYSKT